MALRAPTLLVLLTLVLPNDPLHSSTASVQARIDRDQQLGHPVVAHVIVALCDNENQGIVPVSDTLGNGQDPRTNLYWGALYGVRTHLLRSGYQRVEGEFSGPEGVLERIVLSKSVLRAGQPVELFVVAEAWDGRRIGRAIERFFELAAGRQKEAVSIRTGSGEQILRAGGSATVIAFVGHNGLMDFPLSTTPEAIPSSPVRGSVVLACASKPYFLEALRSGGSHPLLLTNGLMAPEAYTLDAVLTSLVQGADSGEIHESAAQAYNAYQKCGLRGARGLFFVE